MLYVTIKGGGRKFFRNVCNQTCRNTEDENVKFPFHTFYVPLFFVLVL
jgi:hypothetical protein